MKIDKNVPMPKTGNGPSPGRPRAHSYPLDEMNPGDSFYSEDGWKKLSNRTQAHRRRHGTLFQIRKEGTGHRVWRLAPVNDLLS